MTALMVGLLAGGALSVLPRPAQRVQGEVTTPGVIPKQVVPMEMDVSSRGYPFQTWQLETGPVDASVPTHANINIRLRGVALNVLITTLAALLIAVGTARRRED